LGHLTLFTEKMLHDRLQSVLDYVINGVRKVTNLLLEILNMILAYWGNYTATCAYIFQCLTNEKTPFSTFLHADIDLYENQIFLRQKLLYADNIFVVCDFNREFVRNLYPDIYQKLAEKIHLHHTALDLSRFPYNPSKQRPRRVLAVGRLAKSKGYDYLLRAIRELSLRKFDVNLDIVGDGEEAKALRNLAKNLGLEYKVNFKGWLTFEEVRRAMTQATILVQPSPVLGDAVPTVIKEAMALGTPVIATPIAGIPELLDHGRCGLLVPPKDVLELANAMERLLKDETLRMRYAEAAREFAEVHFDVWMNGRKLVDILRKTRRLGT
jgi:glycosyltransferase involved in cell wall biosynthesis